MKVIALSFGVLMGLFSALPLRAETMSCRVMVHPFRSFGLDSLQQVRLELAPGRAPVLRSPHNLSLRGRLEVDPDTGVQTYRFPRLYIRANLGTQPFICGNSLTTADEVRMFFYLYPGESENDTRDSLTFTIDPRRPELNSVHYIREERRRGVLLGVRTPACFSHWSINQVDDFAVECTAGGVQ